MFETHAFCNLVRDAFAGKLTQQFVGVREGSSRTFTRRDSTVDCYEIARIFSFVECILKAWIAGGLLAVENPQRGEHYGRRSTDGGNLLALLLLVQ